MTLPYFHAGLYKVFQNRIDFGGSLSTSDPSKIVYIIDEETQIIRIIIILPQPSINIRYAIIYPQKIRVSARLISFI